MPLEIALVMKQKMSYLVACIRDFGSKYGLAPNESFAYLDHYKGLQFLIDCYEAEHTLSLEDAVSDITMICKRNGGRLG